MMSREPTGIKVKYDKRKLMIFVSSGLAIVILTIGFLIFSAYAGNPEDATIGPIQLPKLYDSDPTDKSPIATPNNQTPATATPRKKFSTPTPLPTLTQEEYDHLLEQADDLDIPAPALDEIKRLN